MAADRRLGPRAAALVRGHRQPAFADGHPQAPFYDTMNEAPGVAGCAADLRDLLEQCPALLLGKEPS